MEKRSIGIAVGEKIKKKWREVSVGEHQDFSQPIESVGLTQLLCK